MSDSKWNKIPNGGFPNIKLKNTDDFVDQTKKTYSKNPSLKIVNVTEILQKKRHTDPYLPFTLDNENK